MPSVNRLDRLPPYDEHRQLRVVIESPAGAAIKLKYDPRLGVMQWGRPLPLGMHYPFDWGFVPGTLAEDGDPVDAVVIHDTASFPGIIIPCRALGVIEVEQDDAKGGARVRNDRIVAVPVKAPRADHLATYRDLAERTRAELEAFFLNAVAFEKKHARIIGVGTGAAALQSDEVPARAQPRWPARQRASASPRTRSFILAPISVRRRRPNLVASGSRPSLPNRWRATRPSRTIISAGKLSLVGSMSHSSVRARAINRLSCIARRSARPSASS